LIWFQFFEIPEKRSRRGGMAEFILGNPLRRLARRHPPLRNLLWWLDFALVWLLVKTSGLLPVDLASRLGYRAGRWIGPRLTSKTALFRQNMHIAFPELSGTELDERVREAWGQAGRILAEYPHLGKILADPHRLEIVVREPFASYTDPGRPCVVVSGHISNWEVVCLAMARLRMPNVSLYTPPTNPFLDRMLADRRRALNCELLPRDNSTRPLIRALKSGRTVGMVMDRRVDGGYPIPFFGRTKSSTLIPARLALKFDCELVPAQVERLADARFRITFHPPVRPRSGAGETERAADMTEQLHGMFEDWIRSNPADWFCSSRLEDKDKSRPAATAPHSERNSESHAA
jgi:KDO2-lipid IV(A) lauroyltransferase